MIVVRPSRYVTPGSTASSMSEWITSYPVFPSAGVYGSPIDLPPVCGPGVAVGGRVAVAEGAGLGGARVAVGSSGGAAVAVAAAGAVLGAGVAAGWPGVQAASRTSRQAARRIRVGSVGSMDEL